MVALGVRLLKRKKEIIKLVYWSNEGFKVKGTYLIEDKSVNYVG